jgi:UPF0271 protein
LIEGKVLTRHKKRVLILDTSAFIAGFDPLSVNEEQYTVPTVKDELIERSLPGVRFKAAVNHGKLKLRTPRARFLDEVKASSKAIGDVLFLSPVDLQVLALALEQKSSGYEPVIVSDDYSIQNVADRVDIDFVSLSTFGIRFQLKWVIYCPACHRKYPSDYKFKSCKICDTKLKRKPLRKTPVGKTSK